MQFELGGKAFFQENGAESLKECSFKAFGGESDPTVVVWIEWITSFAFKDWDSDTKL